MSSDKNLEMALKLLVRKNYHSLELTKKLKEKGMTEEVLHPVIERLQKDGYLDDAAWEEAFISRYCRKGKGAAALGNDLHAKGLLSLLPKLKNKVESNEKELIKAQIQRFKGNLDNPAEKSKFFQRLQRRGFKTSDLVGFFQDIEPTFD